MNGENEEDYLFGRAEIEEDQPREVPSDQEGEKLDQLDEKKLAAQERDKDRKERRYFSAFSLIEICLAILVGIYLLETFMRFKTGQGAEGLAENVIEIIKTLLFTLSGYLFAKRED